MTLTASSSITDEDRQRIIIEFIRSRQYCNVEEVVQGVKDDISRVTVFKILHKLIETGAVQRHLENKQKRNSREHKLFVDEGNPLVSVRFELEKFEKAYFDLFSKALSEVKPKLRQAGAEATNPTMQIELAQAAHLAISLWRIFYSMVDACLFHFLFVWPQKISDQQVLQELYSMVFSKIAEMQIRLSEGLKFAGGRDMNWVLDLFLKMRLEDSSGGSGELAQYLDSFKEVGMEKEIEPVIDSLWKIFGDLQPYVYSEPRTYDWPFKYGEDDWRKLVNLFRKYNKSTSNSKVRSRSSAAA